MRIESNDLVVRDVLAVDAARVVLRAAVGVKRGVMRRRDKRVMVMTSCEAAIQCFHR